jgi:RND family efflux transporter MFP subunit
MKGILIGGLLISGQLAAQDLPAVTDWQQRVTLSTVANGMVAKVNVSVGDQVARGDLLVELDQRSYQPSLAAAESRREASRQLNEEARRELDRALELFDRTLLSDHERKLAEIDAAKADAEFREAEAALAELRLAREYSRINAPFDGLVVELLVQPGQAVVNRLNSVPLLTLVENQRMKAVTQVDERIRLGLHVGDAVQVGVRGNWLTGEISNIGLDPLSTTANGAVYQLEASFKPSAEIELRSGEKAVVRLRDE